LIQKECTPENIAKATEVLLSDPAHAQQTRDELIGMRAGWAMAGINTGRLSGP